MKIQTSMLAKNLSSFCIGSGGNLKSKLIASIIGILSILILIFVALPIRNYVIYVEFNGEVNYLEEVFFQTTIIIYLIVWIVFGWFRLFSLIWIISKYSQFEGYYSVRYNSNFFEITQILNNHTISMQIEFKDIVDFSIHENNIILTTLLKEEQTWPNIEGLDSSQNFRTNWIYRNLVSNIICRTPPSMPDRLIEIKITPNSIMTMSDKILLVNSISRN